MIGDVIRKYRRDNNLSQAEMAKKLEVSPSYISSLERNVRNAAGRPYEVSNSVLVKMSRVMGISISKLKKEMQYNTFYLSEPVNDEESELITLYRTADAETKAMIRRLLEYVKSDTKRKGHNHGKKGR